MRNCDCARQDLDSSFLPFSEGDFLDTISLEMLYSDPKLAAEAVFTKLPKSSDVAGRLRSQVKTDPR